MKIRTMFEIIKENMFVHEKDFRANSKEGLILTKECKEKIKKISELPTYKNEKKELEEFLFDNNFLKYEWNNDSNIIYRKLIKISSEVTLFYNAFESLYPKLDETSISIKLPHSTDLEKISVTIAQINKILNPLIIHEEIGGKLEVVNFDHGSLWLDIILYSLAATTLVASITYSAAYIKKEQMRLKLIEIEVKKNELQVHHIENMVNTSDELLKKMIEKEAKMLKEKCYPLSENDKELDNRIIYAIKEMNKLINDGIEIHPALEVSNEIKHEFPDLRYIENLASKQKSIEDKN